MPSPASAEIGTTTVSPPNSSGTSAAPINSCFTRSGLAFGRSVLLTATTIGTPAARAWVDRLARLRHHSVVGGDDDDRDVRDLRAASAHLRERRVARGVDEGEHAPIRRGGLIGADVLGDAAGFAIDDPGAPDRVEQCRLAVVDVPEHGHHRRARLRVLAFLDDAARQGSGLTLARGGSRLLAAFLLGRVPEVGGDDGGRVEVHDLVDGRHHAVLHQFLDHVDGRDAEQAREVADDDRGGNRDARRLGR